MALKFSPTGLMLPASCFNGDLTFLRRQTPIYLYDTGKSFYFN